MKIKILLSLVLICFTAFELACAATETTRTIPLDQARRDYAAANSKFIDVEGIEVHYREDGQGPAILLVHGTLGDTADWDGWAKELSKDYRVIRFDLPGFGLTGEIANENYSIDRSLSLIDAFMDQLGEERFAIAGISYGGIVTFRYAATRSDRITAMVLVNSAGIQAGKTLKPEKPKEKVKTIPRPNLFTSPIVLKKDIELFYRGYINDDKARTPEFVQRKLDFMNIIGRDVIADKARALYERGNPQRVLKHVKAPVAVLWGLGNKALDTETADAFIEAMPNACSSKLITFESGGHYINVEKPKATALAAKAFLDEVLLKDKLECP